MIFASFAFFTHLYISKLPVLLLGMYVEQG